MCDIEKIEPEILYGSKIYMKIAQQKFRNRQKVKAKGGDLNALSKDELIKLLLHTNALNKEDIIKIIEKWRGDIF